MRRWGSLALVVMLSTPAWGFTSAKLDVNTEELKGQADEVAIRDGISGSVKSVLSGIKGVYRKTYRFAAGNSYEEGAVTSIRSQMTDGGWSPMIDVQDKKQNKGLTVYSYTATDGTSPNGVTVISTDPGEITVLNLVGDIDLDALADVGATLGMPAMSIATTELGTPKLPLPPAPKKK